MHELVRPELEGGVLDELDEGDEQPPGVRPVHDQPLQQHPGEGGEDEEEDEDDGKENEDAPGDLLLDGLGVGLGEKVEEAAGEVVRVRVRVTQLVRDAIQEQVPGVGKG